MNRLDLYLQWGVDTPAYVNTKTEQELVTKFEALFCMAQAAQNRNVLANPENIAKWRKAYYGTLNALKADGTESERRARQVRKMVYEFVESKVDNSIPQPKMMPRYKTDLPLVEVTEDFLKYNTDVILLSTSTTARRELLTWMAHLGTRSGGIAYAGCLKLTCGWQTR